MKKEERTPIRARGLRMIPFETREEWLAIRHGYIGGSDAGAIIGMNPYNSAFSVWAEKTGAVLPFSGNIATRTGTLLEELVAKLFMEETGKKVQKLNYTIVNPEFPFACANLDREIIGEDAFLECKTTNSLVNIRQFRTGEFPDIYYAQCVHYMAVTGAKKAYLAVLSECRDFRVFELERDDDEIAALMEAERSFWNDYVLTDKTPPTDGHSATSSAIRQMWPEDDGETIDLSDIEAEFALRKNLKSTADDIKAELEEIENRIKLKMGEASKGISGRFTVSWKNQTRNSLDADALKADHPEIDMSKYTRSTSSRVFRVTEKKEKTA